MTINWKSGDSKLLRSACLIGGEWVQADSGRIINDAWIRIRILFIGYGPAANCGRFRGLRPRGGMNVQRGLSYRKRVIPIYGLPSAGRSWMDLRMTVLGTRIRDAAYFPE